MAELKTRKVNLGLSLTKNYDKVVLDIIDESIEYITEEEFEKECHRIYEILRKIINKEFNEIGGSK